MGQIFSLEIHIFCLFGNKYDNYTYSYIRHLLNGLKIGFRYINKKHLNFCREYRMDIVWLEKQMLNEDMKDFWCMYKVFSLKYFLQNTQIVCWNTPFHLLYYSFYFPSYFLIKWLLSICFALCKGEEKFKKLRIGECKDN